MSKDRQSRLINDNNQGAAKEIQKKIKQRQNGIALLKRHGRWMCPTRINKWPDPLKSRKVAPLAFFGVKEKTGYFSSEHLLRKLPSFLGDERRRYCWWVSVLEKMRGKERRRQSTKVCESRYSTLWWRKITFRMKSPQAFTSSDRYLLHFLVKFTKRVQYWKTRNSTTTTKK